MACDVSLDSTTTTGTNHYTFGYHGCSAANTGTANVAFVQTEVDEDTDEIFHVFDLEGLNTGGLPISESNLKMAAAEIEDEGEGPVGDAANVNPTKVFLWIAKKIKDVVCPQCID